tara:strand:+ start:877 stop:1365 length:489 start_codon:yes stop_codon:yes gene_type:complete
MIGIIITMILMTLFLYCLYYLQNKIRKSIFNYVNQYSKNDCYIKLLNNKIIIKLDDDDMYLLSKNFRERCYKKSYKNSNILISDNEISFINKNINFNNFDLNVNDQLVKKGDVYYKDNNGSNLSFALKDHETKCLIIGNVSDDNFNKIKFNKNDYIVDMGIN